jgi:hypothetical protein
MQMEGDGRRMRRSAVRDKNNMSRWFDDNVASVLVSCLLCPFNRSPMSEAF